MAATSATSRCVGEGPTPNGCREQGEPSTVVGMTNRQATATAAERTTAVLSGMQRGRWVVDASCSHLQVAVRVGGLASVHGRFPELSGHIEVATDPLASRIVAQVGTATLTTGNAYWDAVLTSAGLVDTAANPIIRFDSTGMSPGTAAGRRQLNGLLRTRSSELELTLDLAGPIILAPDRVRFRAHGALPRVRAAQLLSRPGVQRLLGPTLHLDLAVEATFPMP